MILREEPVFQFVMKVLIIVLLFINAANTLAANTSAITVRDTTQYSADIELVDKQHHRSISFARCNGTQTYTDEYRAVIEEKSQIKEDFPNGNSRVWISNLIPNCNYICVVVQKDSANYKTLSLVTFSTKYGAPLPPPTPEVTTEITNRQLVVTILLFESSTKRSPISGYKLQFYVVETDADGKPVLSQSKPSGLIPSLENARNSLTPTDFLYQTYDAASMPDTVIVQPVVLLGAFKHNFTYSAVLSACRNESEGHEYEEATSEPSAAFKIIYSSERDKYDFRTRYARNVIGIVMGGVVPVLLCISAIILLSMWCKYRKKKTTNTRFQKKKQEKFKYPTFDASRKSLFTIKSPSPQYQPKKNLDYDQVFEQPTNRRTSDGVLDKGINAFRRTSITLVNAFTDFTHSLKGYSWISDVDTLIEEEREGLPESNELNDAKEGVANSSKTNYYEDPIEGIDVTEIAGSNSSIKNIGDIQTAEDPERVMGNVITICSTPTNESRSMSSNQLQMVDIFPKKPQEEEPLQ